MSYRCRSTSRPITACGIICCSQSLAAPLKQRFTEPIFQAYVKRPDAKPIHCLSKKCDHCLSDYFAKSLPRSHYQVFHDQKETLEMGRPTAIISSPTITLRDEQMNTMQDEAIEKLQEIHREIRKRYALMQMEDGVFIVGGYVVDAKTGEKTPAKNEYFYDNNSKELISVPPLPGDGRMAFGLAATDDNKIISVGGHNFNFECMATVSMLDTRAETWQWQSLPDMPNGTIGPGVSVIEDELYVIGGFDFLGQDTECNGDVLVLNLETKQWKTLPDITPPRARPLISIIDHLDPPPLFIAGGYNFDKKGKAVPYDKVEEYDRKKKRWQVIADIPQFKTTNGLATKSNKLFLMDITPETGESHVIKEFNLETRQWESSHDLKKSSSRRLKKQPSEMQTDEEKISSKVEQ